MEFILDGVRLPVPLSENFITPDFEKVLDFYPTYASALDVGGYAPSPRREYLLRICKELERAKIRGRTSDDWLQRIIEHFGLTWLADRLVTEKN